MIHPELRKELYKEFCRLRSKYPHLNNSQCDLLAHRYMRALCDANTKLFMSKNITINKL